MIAEKCIPIFIQAIDDYHVKDDINSTLVMPSELNNFEALLYEKCWIDTVQWQTVMNFLSNSRQFHKALAPWVFLPLLISSITGLLYRVSKDLLGYSRDQVHWLMSLHEEERN